MNIEIKDKVTGETIDPWLLFLNEASDGGVNSIATTIQHLAKDYDIVIDTTQQPIN